MALFDNLFRKKSIPDAIKAAADEEIHGGGLEKNLSVVDLTALGIAAIIGAGIFSTIGRASFEGGPAVVFLFIFTAVACGFAALAYAEFASLLPVSGSAYTYSYVAFGEMIAWVIGWALIMEYAVGNITVAVSWSSYFTSLCESAGWHIPAWATVDYTSAHAGFNDATALIKAGTPEAKLTVSMAESYHAWQTAPVVAGLRMILDIPAIIMSVLITGLVYIGIKETKTASNIFVGLKLIVVLLVIVVGVFYIDTANWHPFIPNGFGGVMGGVSSVFFAYIGFDALSTTAEECKNPQRDLPKAMINSIIICTILYIFIALILTGLVSYKLLDVDDPLAFVFQNKGIDFGFAGMHIPFSGIIAVSAVVAMAGVFLVFQLGQPRIWMTMSRDGLLPKRFSAIHPKFKTPGFATVITGLFVVVPMLFIPSDTVLDLCSMGTLFAFVLVCAGVLKMKMTPDSPRGKFQAPYVNAKWIFPAMIVLGLVFMFGWNKTDTVNWLTNAPEMYNASDLVSGMKEGDIERVKSGFAQSDSAGFAAASSDLVKYLGALDGAVYTKTVETMAIDNSFKYESGWSHFQHKIPMWLFIFTCIYLMYMSFKHNMSLIPVLGLVFCFYMMAQIPAHSWLGFFIWLLIGLVIYFGYSYSNSKLKGRVKTS